jgi:hypothetical protein
VVETALLSAIFAFLPELALAAFLIISIHEAIIGPWPWHLRLLLLVPTCLTPPVAAVAGGIFARRARPPRPVLRWLLIGLGARAATLLCGALVFLVFFVHAHPASSILLWSIALPLTVAAAAYPVPMMWAVIVHAIVSRRRTRMVMRVTLATLVTAAVAFLGKSAVTGFVERAQSVEQMSVSPSGRVYVATRAGLFAADPETTTLRYLRCGSLGTPVTTVTADARNAALVWAGPEMPNAAATNLLESRDAGRTWHPIAGLPPPNYVLSTRSAIYATSDWKTLWVNRSGEVGDWEKRPLNLPRIDATGRGAVSPGLMAASSEQPGVVILADEYGISEIQASREAWRGVLYRTRDFGETWERVTIPLLVDVEHEAREQIHDIAIIPGSPQIVAVAAWWGLLISFDEGRHWRRLERPLGEHATVVGAPTVPPTIYLLVDDRLYASDDLGLTWRDSRGAVSCIATDPTDPRRIYAGSWRGVYRSQDGGRTWRQLSYSFLPMGPRGR